MQAATELTNAGHGPSREEDAAKKAQEEQMQRELMATLLDTNARERCTYELDYTLVASFISLSHCRHLP
jgi:hypothetical protein